MPFNPNSEPREVYASVNNQIANSSGIVTIATDLPRVRRARAAIDVGDWTQDKVNVHVAQVSGNKVDVVCTDCSGTAEHAVASADISGCTISVWAEGD